MTRSCDILTLEALERLSLAEEILGYTFTDKSLLREALTHPSYTGEHPGDCMYERLEFLGDAVLDLIVVEEVFRRFPELPEGNMTKIKIAVVSGTTLSAVAGELGLDKAIFVGESEKGTAGRGMTSALENTLEALLGAIHLDSDLDSARVVALRLLGHLIDPRSASALDHPKSRLQEIMQAKGSSPEYRITDESGPPHSRSFTSQVSVDGVVLGTGNGRTKKTAEMAAAAQAVRKLESD
ncbi:MAG: ribonuclease III [Actinomycetota bacterium]|jgi:ribonuclease-3|nr:ribonuclease III [Actinomycetota bacterium]